MKFGNKLVFVAGPYRGDGQEETKRANIVVAREYIQKLIDAQIPYYSPHLNLSQETITRGDMTEDYAIATHDLFLKRCDVLVILPGWQESTGTKEEVENANSVGMPVFFLEESDAIERLKQFLAEEKVKG